MYLLFLREENKAMRDYQFFAPRISADTKFFWDSCRNHELKVQKCKRCGKLRWPASYLCPECLCEKSEAVNLPERGVLYSFTIFRKAFHPSLKEALPYVVGEVDLEGGVRLITNIVGCNLENLKCNAVVKLEWQDFEEYTKPVFVLEE